MNWNWEKNVFPVSSPVGTGGIKMEEFARLVILHGLLCYPKLFKDYNELIDTVDNIINKLKREGD